MTRQDDEEHLIEYLRVGKDAAGNIFGATVGYALGDITGAFFGAAVSPVFSQLISQLGDYSARQLSILEKQRTGVLGYLAINKIKSKIELGEQVRVDGFFDETSVGRSGAKIIFESALNKARNEHQAKKINFYANLVANLCFRDDISADAADILLFFASSLSYRQFCYLEFVRSNSEIDVHALRGVNHSDIELALFQREEIQLHRNPLGIYGLLSGPKKAQFIDALSPEGKIFVELTETKSIDKADLYHVNYLLAECRANGA